MTLYLYRNILNVDDTLLFLSHIYLRTFDFIANYHFVFVTIIPTHMVFALSYFIPPKVQSYALFSLHGDGVRWGSLKIRHFRQSNKHCCLHAKTVRKHAK